VAARARLGLLGPFDLLGLLGLLRLRCGLVSLVRTTPLLAWRAQLTLVCRTRSLCATASLLAALRRLLLPRRRLAVLLLEPVALGDLALGGVLVLILFLFLFLFS
jgi:hypothetical protein